MLDKIKELIFWKIFKYEEDQILMLDKVPYNMIPARAMAKFVQKISDDLGVEKVMKIGYDAGLMVAEDLVKELGWANTQLPGKMNIMKKMFNVMGFGEMDLKIWDTENKKVLLHVTHHPTLEWAEKLYQKNQKVSQFYMAIYSAHAHTEFGIENCWLIETQRISDGAKFYEWSYNVISKDEKKDQ